MCKNKSFKKLPLNKGTIEVTSFFGGWSPRGGSCPMLNGDRVTASNIENYKLYIRYKDESVVYYTWYKNNGTYYISHDKKTGVVDWFEGLNNSVSCRKSEKKMKQNRN